MSGMLVVQAAGVLGLVETCLFFRYVWVEREDLNNLEGPFLLATAFSEIIGQIILLGASVGITTCGRPSASRRQFWKMLAMDPIHASLVSSYAQLLGPGRDQEGDFPESHGVVTVLSLTVSTLPCVLWPVVNHVLAEYFDGLRFGDERDDSRDSYTLLVLAVLHSTIYMILLGGVGFYVSCALFLPLFHLNQKYSQRQLLMRYHNRLAAGQLGKAVVWLQRVKIVSTHTIFLFGGCLGASAFAM